MIEEFTKKDEKKLKKRFPFYSDKELKDFMVKAFGERGLLILSSDPKDPRNKMRERLIKTLERLQDDAFEELQSRKKKKKLKEVL